VFQGKPVVYLSTSPGPGGAGSVLASAIASVPFFGADVIASLSVPSFQNNFNLEQNQWVNPEIRQALETVMEQLADAVHRDCKAA